MKIKEEFNKITETLNSDYGLIVLKNNKSIYEKYKNNNRKSRFRIFSGTKIITALAIMILIDQNKLKITDTINKFGINIPNSERITILHLLNHTSGIFDIYLELYVKLNLMEYLHIKSGSSGLIEFKTIIEILNNNKPYFAPIRNPYKTGIKYYNNTGYDILGYVIYKVSKLIPGDYIRINIFEKLDMRHSGFQIDNHKDECISYENKKEIGIKAQQNWYCANAFIVCSLLDYGKFVNGYKKLINSKTLDIYNKLYFFKDYKKGSKTYKRLGHQGGGDFAHNHIIKKEEYYPITRTIIQHYENNKDKITIIMSENYQNTNGFFSNNYKNWSELWFKLDSFVF